MGDFFNPFVIPFCLGTALLFIICIWKYVSWIRQFDRLQRTIVRKNIFTWKFLGAIWEMLTECLFHFRITRKNKLLGYMHRSIAFGWFLLIVVGAVESRLALGGGKPFWVSIFFRFFEHNPHTFGAATFFTNLMDLLLLYVLSGVLLAYSKRIYSRMFGMKSPTKHVIFDKFALSALWCIFPLRLLSESATAALYHNGGFMTQAIGNLFSQPVAAALELPLWTLYSIALGSFFVAMPFSRYMHIFTEVFLIYFRKLGVKEHEQPTGYTKFELSACSRCGICIDACPLNNYLDIKNIQPVYFLRDLRYNSLQPEVVNNCLMCGRCEADCPVNIEQSAVRKQMRNKKEIDTHDNYNYVERVKPFSAIGRVAYFGGCMSHLTPGITEAMCAIFEAAGQKYWYMDQDKTVCCGKPLAQQGFYNQATELRRENTRLIVQSGAQLLVTSCPICYQEFKKEYRLPIKVMHHTEYINMLIASGRLQVQQSALKVVYHDPCELGRGCGIYDEPRSVLKAVATPVKARYEKEKSICCGYNLGNTVLESDQQGEIRDASMRSLLCNNPDVIATACPMCKKAFMHAKDFPVKDIAEIVKDNLIS